MKVLVLHSDVPPDAPPEDQDTLIAARAIAQALKREVWPLLDVGKVKPVIYKTFPLKEAAAAHALMESSAHIGKIVLTI